MMGHMSHGIHVFKKKIMAGEKQSYFLAWSAEKNLSSGL